MKYYELTCLISPNLSEAELKSFQQKIVSLVQKEQGILDAEIQDKPAKKRLAYPITSRMLDISGGVPPVIKKTVQALLITFNFQLNPEGLENLKRKIIVSEEVLRYTILAKKLPKAIKISKKPIKTTKKIPQPKVELKEIEKKLEEILGEQ